jgi:hypothetical protein
MMLTTFEQHVLKIRMVFNVLDNITRRILHVDIN